MLNNTLLTPSVLNLRKEKWLFDSIYKPPLKNNQYFVGISSNFLSFYSNKYNNKVILGDFNFKLSSPSMFSFMNSQNVVNLMKKTCFKGGNRKYSFKNTSLYKIGYSHHHHLIYSVMKITFKCEEPKHLNYANRSNFLAEIFPGWPIAEHWRSKQ